MKKHAFRERLEQLETKHEEHEQTRFGEEETRLTWKAGETWDQTWGSRANGEIPPERNFLYDKRQNKSASCKLPRKNDRVMTATWPPQTTVNTPTVSNIRLPWASTGPYSEIRHQASVEEEQINPLRIKKNFIITKQGENRRRDSIPTLATIAKDNNWSTKRKTTIRRNLIFKSQLHLPYDHCRLVEAP